MGEKNKITPSLQMKLGCLSLYPSQPANPIDLHPWSSSSLRSPRKIRRSVRSPARTNASKWYTTRSKMRFIDGTLQLQNPSRQIHSHPPLKPDPAGSLNPKIIPFVPASTSCFGKKLVASRSDFVSPNFPACSGRTGEIRTLSASAKIYFF